MSLDLYKYVLIGVGIGLALAIIFLLIWKIRRFLTLHSEAPKIQLPEIWGDKYFITSDQQKLKLKGFVNKSGKSIYVGFHDFIGTSNTFDEIFSNNMTNKNSFISYQQQALDPILKQYNISSRINHGIEFIQTLKRLYPTQNIYLLLEGYSCGLAHFFLKIKKMDIKKVIYINPISNKKAMKFGFIAKFGWFFGWFTSWMLSIQVQINYKNLTNNKTHLKILSEGTSSYRLIELLQYRRINRNIFIQIAKHQSIVPSYIIQSDGDPFYSKFHFVTKTSTKNLKIFYVSEQKHFNINYQLSKFHK